MWICLSNGMVSVVCDRNDKTGNSVVVRSRGKNHLEDLFPEMAPISMAGSDYKYRVFVSKKLLKERLNAYIDEIEYDNFKDSVRDPVIEDFYLNIWQRGLIAQIHGDFDRENDYLEPTDPTRLR